VVVRNMRLLVAAALVGSGALMYAASWQRWADACPWGARSTAACLGAQDHRYDFLVPAEPWTPIGGAAELAGLSLLVLALAVALLPWGLTGRRPGPFSALTLAATVPSVGLLGVTNLRSGLAGQVMEVPFERAALLGWGLLLPSLIAWLAWASRGWARVGGWVLVTAMPFPGIFLYWIGPYDAAPWYEGISGILTALAGLCVLVAASGRTPVVRDDAPDAAAVARS